MNKNEPPLTPGEELEAFFERQLEAWPSARENYRKLRDAERRSVDFGEFKIDIQHNPARIGSATAKIDAESLRERACFLCREHLPAEQSSLDYNEELEIRVNPFPIFGRHFTVPSKRHIPQRIGGHFGELLDLARRYPRFTAFYNGPESGASAPDHFHFQLVPRGAMPLERDAARCRRTTLRGDIAPGVEATSIAGYVRRNIILQGGDEAGMEKAFRRVTDAMRAVVPGSEEPMMNLFAWHEGGQWTVAIFPRRRHRPWQYFAEGKDRIVFSPGCADFAGFIISPRREDFERLDAPLLKDLFGQLTPDEEEWNALVKRIQNQKA